MDRPDWDHIIELLRIADEEVEMRSNGYSDLTGPGQQMVEHLQRARLEAMLASVGAVPYTRASATRASPARTNRLGRHA